MLSPARCVPPGIVGTLARGNAVRNPRRTAATASALVIGFALVGLVAVFGDSAKASISRAVNGGIRADLVLKAQQFASFSPNVAQRVAQLPLGRGGHGVPVRKRAGPRSAGTRRRSRARAPAGLEQVVDLGLRQGSVAAMGSDGVLVAQDASREYGLRVGSLVGMQFPDAGPLTLRVVGIYTPAGLHRRLPRRVHRAAAGLRAGFGTAAGDTLVYVRARPGQTAAAAAAVHRALTSFPNISVYTRAQYTNAQEQTVNRVLAVTIALLMLSEIIAVLGIVNTLALSVYERTRASSGCSASSGCRAASSAA